MLQHLLRIALLGTAALSTAWCDEVPAGSCSRYLTLDPKAQDDKQIHIGGDGVSPETSTIMRAYAYYYPLYASYRALVVSSWVRRDSVGTVMNYDAPTIRSSVPRQSMAAVYSSVFLDQDKGPFRVTYPMVSPNETFLSVSILDLFTEQLLPTINNQFNSTELTGSFELYGGNNTMSLTSDSNATRFTCQTQYCWIAMRFFVSDRSPEELEKIKKWQNEIRVETIHDGQYETTQVTMPMLGEVGQAGESVESFFDLVNRLAESSPPQPELPILLDSFKSLGIGPGLKFDTSSLSPDVQKEIQNIPSCFEEVMLNTNLGVQSSSEWKYAIDAGQYGENYLERAYIAVNGLGATIPRDIIYASHDGLDAQYAYRMDFTADSIPETYAWSMQIYNQEGKIEKNPENIYDINSRSTALNRTEDGSVTILFQRNQPVDASAGINWMPTSGYQDGESFLPLIRFYSPGESILSREYQIPTITKYTANE